MKLKLKRSNQKGTSMVEFLVVMPVLMFTGLAILQLGLIYHANSVLKYATFEAARAGAVMNGQREVMRKELGYRLAPIYGGDGGLKRGAMALARSTVAVNDITATKIEILSPSPASFGAHGIPKDIVDRHGDSHPQATVIPNSHLRFAPAGEQEDGLSLHDANLLKIKVTYGYQMRLPFLDMKIPGMKWIMRNFMIYTDRDNWMYYIRGMLPMTASATVRMQSDAWEWQEDPPVVRAFDAVYDWVLEQIRDNDGNVDGEPGEPGEPGECEPEPIVEEGDEHGLTGNETIVAEAEPASGVDCPGNEDDDDDDEEEPTCVL